MSNLSDSEIIKALDDLIHLGDAPIGKDYGVIIDKQTLKDTLDLINRLKAEITRLNGCVKTEEEVRIIAKSVIDSNIAFIKSEARKEFTEKLLRKATFMRDEEKINGVVRVGDIYETLEEMGCDNA